MAEAKEVFDVANAYMSDDEEVDTNTAFHIKKLESFCRICGDPKAQPDDRKPTPVKLFAKDIKNIWQIDITKDEKARHPRNICRACQIRIKR